ncbi:MAG: tRNA threonylcarbamoyladenosine dehydratase [Selenomonas sp.]|uniref:tRNA threonylcarbamoyladenosine dehydratase n=1 Tax=Selenomonas sp. TaxID=2053611 RepID=UPI0025D653A6|nr:tRNA threonylcarbamoyladenosine dehydratase [Selenomonas sp.]MCR5438322.1 tRNA threonylcarbamoyladenosine dehydratase [Selenomonas sp.]
MEERTIREEMLLGSEAVEQLRRSHVAVFGLGGVGSWCCEGLARAGIGRLTLVDRDTVGLSNCNRQLCALTSTLGLEKTAVMAARVRDINPDAVVRTITGHYEAAGRERFFADYDFVVDAIDLVACKLDLILSCRERGIPIVSALGTGNKRDAGQLRLDDIANTYGCTFARVIRRELRERGVEHHPVVYSPEKPMKPEQVEAPPPGRRSVPGSLVWVPAATGMLLCQYVVTELTKT